MPGGGDFVSPFGVGILFRFFRPGGRSFALKSCPQGRDFDGKISGSAVSPGGGGVTGQIDTCIRFLRVKTKSNSDQKPSRIKPQ